ncbi:hypothetical protein FRC01_012247 [Tulasnella sp. 417]|nr:hypothetical protein FRC01_012247 [Tulasnella sp. 417]
MEDPQISNLKVDRFKRLYNTIIPELPGIVETNSTSTWKYTPPRIPRAEAVKAVELVLDPDLPESLINGLHRLADELEEDQLDDKILNEVEQWMALGLLSIPRNKIEDEVSVLAAYRTIVAEPVRQLCRVLRLDPEYRKGPSVLNLSPGYAWAIGDKPIAIFEHKTPKVLNHHAPQIVSKAPLKRTIDLTKGAKNGESIIAKLILASITEGLEYCVVHSLTSFMVIRLVQNPQSGLRQARISNPIPLTSTATPIIALTLALILHSRQDGSALEYQPVGLNVVTSSEVHREEDEDEDLNSSSLGPHNLANRKEDTSSSNHSAGVQGLGPNTLAVPEYWEPEEISERTLAALLRTTDGVSLYWEMKPFSREIFRPIRLDDSSLWARYPPTKSVPRLFLHCPTHHQITPPPSPPVTPFVLELNSIVGSGAVGSVYQGQFLGLSIPLVAKVLPTRCMDHELEMWRKLRGLAGICVPGLFGAYSIEGQDGSEDTGVLVQQYAGRTLSSFDTLDDEQRQVPGIIFTTIGRLCELISTPSDVSFIAMLPEFTKQVLNMET